MYKNNRYRFRHNGARRHGGFRVKTFDPSHIISKACHGKIKNTELVKENRGKHQAIHSFTDFDISNRLKVNISKRGFITPTPIQDQAIPSTLKGSDVVGIANTGTGKTAAFLIPLINKVLSDRNQKVLIITPTRELAVQIESEFIKLAQNLGIYSVVCIGGVSINGQIHKLRRRPQFVIGTPGRLLDLIERRILNINQFRSVVLDEVDRMLDMGFIHDIRKIISQLPNERQSLFFSATVGSKVMDIMRKFTKDPTTISVKFQDSAENVKQEIVKVNGRNKIDLLKSLLDKKECRKALVFGRTKRGTDTISKELAKRGLSVSSIHGNKSQNQRQRSLDMFKGGRVNVLVATDVVARGIDVRDITHVINYDLPESYDHYLHRIGRTGRAGKKGVALTFVH